MSQIKYVDTDGDKSRLLPFRHFGLDNYPSGNDVGRVYIGTGSENIPLAKQSEFLAVDSKADNHIAKVDNPHSVTKAQVGLANVDNTSDANKPVSTATQTALNLKANAADAVLTGTPTAPTAAVGTNTTQLATTAYVNAEIANDAPSKIGTGASGTWAISVSGNSATATTLSTNRTNYKTATDSAVVGELMWKNYGNGHTIFDASASTTPTGVAKNNTNPDTAWAATYPTLMGYNGTSTYGVRVDSSRYADQLKTAITIGGVSFDGTANINLAGVNIEGNQNTSGSSGSLSIINRLNSEDANNLTTNSINTWGSNGINIPFSASKILHIGNNSWPTQLGFDAYNNMLSLRTRASSNGTWRAWSKIYTEADPQINITGTAATATNATKLNNTVEDANATANTIVKRDANGYINGVYFHTTAADTTTASSHYYVETGSDGFIRPKPLANVRGEIITKAALLSADPYYFNSGVGTAGITAATNYPIFPAGNDTLTLGVGTYRVSLTMYCSVATSTVSAALMINMRGAGTAVGTTWGMTNSSITNGGAANQTVYGALALGSTHSVTPSSAVAGRIYTVYLEMVMNITTAGTIIPSYQWSATLTSGVVSLHALNNIVIDKMAETSVTTAGGWV